MHQLREECQLYRAVLGISRNLVDISVLSPLSFLPPLSSLSHISQADLELRWLRKTLNLGFLCFYLSNALVTAVYQGVWFIWF